ncbi:Dipeptide-binding protein DppE precursor [Rhodobacteraceae bacterium THAF1]|uniref:ABC transporter substrate-binding protein n=1 Tax=Palleronia sp. THAF1 TaxID=2587842 RepID=UPI000F3D5DAA|nr:ABC transporter substrate-binding protein [Palleronia sp. THAF1]QFU09328.1 Dipeptide-binding protein DppE precursor [Palleronia sp. THAF1]VDC26769.1 Dipeptide-binding protein DppE precursor [Rhodobacteraceae bacterium THAF1]
MTTIHPHARQLAGEVASGALSRREFLTRATALGLTASSAYALLGLMATPARAQERQDGGTLRIQQDVRALKDPRSYDWPQMSNVTRGWLEYLVKYERDGALTPMLLESWDISDDATGYTLNVRPGVTWSDGTPFTAEDVAFNLTRWCDSTVEGNSMAARFSSLIDEATGQAREGAITVDDDTTVTLALSFPDVTLIATFSDYTAAIVPQDFDGDPLNAKGTGAYMPVEYEVGIRAAIEKRPDHQWWGEEVYGPATLERIEFIDFGTDPASWFAAADSGEVDMVYETVGEFIDLFDTLDWTRSESVTSGTVVIRVNQTVEPYGDVRVRRALQLATDNDTLLELGNSGRGQVAANHHVAPIHPDYADIGPSEYDAEQAMALLEEAGQTDHAFELISLDDDWRKNTCDAMAAMLRDAGMTVNRTVVPGSTFWTNWTTYPFSATDWGHRPLGIQLLSLAYKSGVPWNETGFDNAEFDSLLEQAQGIGDADGRAEVMGQLETILRDEGVITQPYWRSTYRHFAANVVGAEQHPAFEIHPYELGFVVS